MAPTLPRTAGAAAAVLAAGHAAPALSALDGVRNRLFPGLAGAGQAGHVALTFDDGPDPTWTPRILDVLRREHVPATFFVIGKEAERYPKLLRQEVDDGHVIGDHTYSHPDLAKASEWRARLEISAIKVIAARAAIRVIDRAIQLHGGAGVSADVPLAEMYAHARTLRIVDGPDDVHKMLIARRELARYGSAAG